MHPSLRKAAALFLLAGLPAGTAPVAAAPAPVPAAERFVERGMPLSAENALLSLPAAARGSSPALPGLLLLLADRGKAASAIALFDEVRPHLAEPVRSETLLAAGRILWRLGEHRKAAGAFREIGRSSRAFPEGQLYLARALAAEGDFAGALQALSWAPGDGRKRLVEGEIEMLRGNVPQARSAWDNARAADAAGTTARILSLSRADNVADASRALRAFADNVAAGLPARTAAAEALAAGLLSSSDYAGALAAARDGIAVAERWRADAQKLPGWDGTKAGAGPAWEALVALHPLRTENAPFFSAGRSFLATAGLLSTVRETENEARRLSRELRFRQERLQQQRKAVEDALRGSDAMKRAWSDGRVRAQAVRGRLVRASENLSLSAWGERSDPKGAAALKEMDRRMADLRTQLERIRKTVSSMSFDGRLGRLPLEDQRMVFFVQARATRAEGMLDAMEESCAYARRSAWNRWKSDYVRLATVLLDGADNAVRTAQAEAARTEKAGPPLAAAREVLASWSLALKKFESLSARDEAVLARRKAELAAGAGASLEQAREHLVEAIRRRERTLHYLAGRAAAERRIEAKGSLLADALRHLESSIPPAGEKTPYLDEALYLAAELRYEEEENRFYEKENAAGQPEYGPAAALFRRVVAEFPDSRYGEPSHYGLALCLQEMGAIDNAVAAMETLLSRYPSTRYADEVNLRLGEIAFDQYDFPRAERHYRKVGEQAPPELRTTALFKLGWSLFLLSRPREAAEPFLAALKLSPKAQKTGGLSSESLKMVARMMVEGGTEQAAETFLRERDASAHGPSLLLQIQGLLDQHNRYEDAAGIADRMGAAYPLASERLDAETGAVEVLRKARRDEDAIARRGNYYAVFGPGTPWQKSPDRTPVEIARANTLAEEGLRVAAFRLHESARADAARLDNVARANRGDAGAGSEVSRKRQSALFLFDAYLSRFPVSPSAEEIAYQRAWLLYEDGKKKEAGLSFEAVGQRPGGARGEASRYMALQCAKELVLAGDTGGETHVVRLAKDYEQAFPKGDRLHLVVFDRAIAHRSLKQLPEAAEAGKRAAALAKGPKERRAALRLAADSLFELDDFAGAEDAFRAILAAGPDREEKADTEKWTGISMFRNAERMPKESASAAGDLFARIAKEFPALEIAPTARFRAGAAYADAGRLTDAIAAFLTVERGVADAKLSLDATRWLANLYEKHREPVPAAERFERLAGVETAQGDKEKLLLHAADLYASGKDEERSRKALLAVAGLPGSSTALRMYSLFRVAESLGKEGRAEEADARYGEVAAIHRQARDAAPDIAGKALFRQAEHRFRRFVEMKIAPPLEETFLAKQGALESCNALYAEAIDAGDAETISASLTRLGEGFEDFRTAILTAPAPDGLSAEEKEEYTFLLEEKAAPIDEKAVAAYEKSLHHAVRTGDSTSWSEKSLQRLKVLRAGRYGKKGEFGLPVLPLPDFRGIVERSAP